MKILHIPDQLPATPAVGSPLAGGPTVSPSAPTFDPEQLTALERHVRSLQEKVRELEERVQAAEAATPSPAPAAAPVRERVPMAEVTWDADTVNKNLLNRMWKYLNDDPRSAKAV